MRTDSKRRKPDSTGITAVRAIPKRGRPGADSNDLVTSTAQGKSLLERAHALFGEDPAFWGRYFKGPGNPSSEQYQADEENEPLRKRGIRVLPIARQTKEVGGTENQGRKAAIANADAIIEAFGAEYLKGLGGGFYVFLDVEPSHPMSRQYYTGWAESLITHSRDELGGKAGFQPCVYLNCSDKTTCKAIEAALKNGVPCLGVWIARYPISHSYTTCVSPQDWDEDLIRPETPLTPPILAWQYVGDCYGPNEHKAGPLDGNQVNPDPAIQDALLEHLILPTTKAMLHATSTVRSDWKDILATADIEQTLARAQEGLGRKTIYKLGEGGYASDIPEPLTPKCDCSGFVCWAIGVSRELPPKSDHWLYTNSIWEGGGDVGSNLFHRVDAKAAIPGDLYVYPSDSSHSYGHIGLIVEVEDGKPTQLLHCSKSNYTQTKDAVRITSPDVIAGNPKSRIMRIDFDRLRQVAGVKAAKGIAQAPEIPLLIEVAGCDRELVDTLEERIYTEHGPVDRPVPVYRLRGKSGYFFRAKMSVDVDGSPKAYHPYNDAIALDYKGNASSDSKRYIQGVLHNGKTGEGPNPGYYVSATSIQDGDAWKCDSYVDGENIPYIVFPSGWEDLKLRNAGIVVNLRNGLYTPTMFADTNPRVGEASYKVATTLGLKNPSPKDGGDEDDNYVYLLFPGPKVPREKQAPFWRYENIATVALKAFEAWGGIAQVQACFGAPRL